MLLVLFNSTEANAKLTVKGKPTDKTMLYVNNQPVLPFCFEPWVDNSNNEPISLSECLQHADIWKNTYNPATGKNHKISNEQYIYGGGSNFMYFFGNKAEWEMLKKEDEYATEYPLILDYHVVAVKDQKTVMIELLYYTGGTRGTMAEWIEINIDENKNIITASNSYADNFSNYDSSYLDCMKKPYYINKKLWVTRSIAIADLVNLLQDRDVVRHKETEPNNTYYVPCRDEKAGEIVEVDRSLSQLSFDTTWLKSGKEGNPDWETCLKNYVLNGHNKGKNLTIKANDFERFKQAYQQACPMAK
ncbi:MAG: hypothetical protein ACOYK8_00455 [Alphaproteobacteria bacterium]